MNRYDYADQVTDEALARLEAKVSRTYTRAAREMKKKLKDMIAGYERQMRWWTDRVMSGRATGAEYQRWLRQQAYDYKYTAQMLGVLSEDAYNSNDIAAQMIREHMPDVYAINANYAAFDIDKRLGLDTNFQLYDKAAVERLIQEHPDLLPDIRVDRSRDLRWNQQKMRNELTQGLLQGESVDKIATRFEKVLGMNQRSAITNARSATTSAQNGGRLSSLKRAQDLGINVWKVWIATMDGSTRRSHRELDGQEKLLNEPFDSEHGPIDHPGDPYADPAEYYNCRCRLGGLTKYSRFDKRDLSRRFSDLPAGIETYEDWVNMKDKSRGES